MASASARPRVVIPAPANQNRAPLASRLARVAALAAGLAIAAWLLLAASS